MDKSILGNFVLMLKAFFQSLVDPTFMMQQGRKGGGGGTEDGGGDASSSDPFAARAKSASKTITVDELEKMGGGEGKSRVKAIKSSAEFKRALTLGKKGQSVR